MEETATRGKYIYRAVKTSRAKKKKNFNKLSVCSRKFEQTLRMAKKQIDKLCSWGSPSAFIYTGLDNNIVSYGSDHMQDAIDKHKDEIQSAAMCSKDDPEPYMRAQTALPVLDPGLNTYNFQMTRELAATLVRLDKGGLRRRLGWGQPDAKPEWWPESAPWTTRGVQSGLKHQQLKDIVTACYVHHGQEESLNADQSGVSVQNIKVDPDLTPQDFEVVAALNDVESDVDVPEEDGVEFGDPLIQSTPAPIIPTPVVVTPKRHLTQDTQVITPQKRSQSTTTQPAKVLKAPTTPSPQKQTFMHYDVPKSESTILPDILGSRIRTVHLPAEKEIIILIADTAAPKSVTVTQPTVEVVSEMEQPVIVQSPDTMIDGQSLIYTSDYQQV